MFTGTRGEGRGGRGRQQTRNDKGGWGGGAVSKNIFFGPSGPQFGLKIRGNPGPLGPSPGSASGNNNNNNNND